MGSRATLKPLDDDLPRLFCLGGQVLCEVHPWAAKRSHHVLMVPNEGGGYFQFYAKVVPRGLSCAYPK